MPVITRTEEQDFAFGALSDLSPAPIERQRARTSALSDALENTLPALLDTAVSRRLADAATDERFTRDQANERAKEIGLTELGGIGDDGISPRGLEILLDRQRRKAQREVLMGIGEIGGFTRLGLGVVGSIPDPVNLIPFSVGARATTLAGAAGKGIAAGAIGSAAVEPAFYALSRYSGDQYSLLDSAANIAFGATLGAGFGAGGYGMAQVGSARERRKVGPVVAQQVADGRPVDVSEAMPDGTPDVEVTAFTNGDTQVTEIGPDAEVSRPVNRPVFDAVDALLVDLGLEQEPLDVNGVFGRAGEPVERRTGSLIDTPDGVVPDDLRQRYADSQAVTVGDSVLVDFDENLQVFRGGRVIADVDPVSSSQEAEFTFEVSIREINLRDSDMQHIREALGDLFPGRPIAVMPRLGMLFNRDGSAGTTRRLGDVSALIHDQSELGGIVDLTIPGVERPVRVSYGLGLKYFNGGEIRGVPEGEHTVANISSITYVGSGFERIFYSSAGPRAVLKIQRAMQELLRDHNAVAIAGHRIGGARIAGSGRPGNAMVAIPRHRRGPAAVDPQVNEVLTAIETQPVVAEAFPDTLAERNALDEQVQEDLLSLEDDVRAEVEAEFAEIDNAFTDADTFDNSIRAAARCALNTGVDDVL